MYGAMGQVSFGLVGRGGRGHARGGPASPFERSRGQSERPPEAAPHVRCSIVVDASCHTRRWAGSCFPIGGGEELATKHAFRRAACLPAFRSALHAWFRVSTLQSAPGGA